MLKIYTSFDSYKPWSGTVDTYNQLQDLDQLQNLEIILDELYPEGIDETALNDILWFEPEFIAESLGLYYNEDTGEITDSEYEDMTDE